MNISSSHGVNEQAAEALRAVEHLRIDGDLLMPQPEYLPASGGFGTVRVAKLGEKLVAVKQLHITEEDGDRARFVMRFVRELKVWAPLDHPNLLKLSGFYMAADVSVAQFICPFYPLGHIRKYIESHKPDRDSRIKFAEDTAFGLQYLHSIHIVHGDLKELNVLVDPEPRALLCDYGVAKMMNPDGASSGLTTTGMPLSVRFASPELMNGSRPDMASDMWAWGCLFTKIVLDIGPYHGTTDWACIGQIVKGMPPANIFTLSLVGTLRGMLGRCWYQDPSIRLSVGDCIRIIRSVRRPESLPKMHDPSSWKKVWDTSSIISQRSLPHEGNETSIDINSVAFSPDDSLLVSGSNNGSIVIWDVASGANAGTFEYDSAVYAIAFAPDGTRLAAGLSEGVIKIWETLNRSHDPWLETNKMRPGNTVLSVAFSPDSLLLGTGSSSGQVDIWDSISGVWLRSLKGHTSKVFAVTFSPDGDWIASCSQDLKIHVWDLIPALYPSNTLDLRPAVTLVGQVGEIHSVVFSPDGKSLASDSGDTTTTIWDTSSWKQIKKLHNSGAVLSLAFSPDGAILVSGTRSGSIELWDTESWTFTSRFSDQGGPVRCVAFSPGGGRIAYGTTTVQILSLLPRPADKELQEESRA